MKKYLLVLMLGFVSIMFCSWTNPFKSSSNNTSTQNVNVRVSEGSSYEYAGKVIAYYGTYIDQQVECDLWVKQVVGNRMAYRIGVPETRGLCTRYVKTDLALNPDYQNPQCTHNGKKYKYRAVAGCYVYLNVD